MSKHAVHIPVITDPLIEDIEPDPVSWLKRLQGATWIDISGKDTTRRRVITTLLHGNEPSGFMALYRWLNAREKPRVNISFLVASVEAALQPPIFSHRMPAQQRDFNRCFRAPFSDCQGQRAAQVIERLQQLQPECVVDIHNTSGSGPSFAVTIGNKTRQRALARWFCRRMVVTDLCLGSLMEVEVGCPIVTIECGGAKDDESETVAFNGIREMTKVDDIFQDIVTSDLEIVHHPIRVELKPGVSIAYSKELLENVDITLSSDIEHHNHGITTRDACLGWVGRGGLALLQANDAAGVEQLARLLREENGWLYPARDLHLFMATTDAAIAREDCLFYMALPTRCYRE